DHDDRVKTPDPYGTGCPLREGGIDSIIEIVTKPAADEAAFDARMNDVDQVVNNINANTHSLTTRWANAYAGHSVGPL
ncbi:hypothetical protein ACYT69_12965, partial [Streptococcus pyogenes]